MRDDAGKTIPRRAGVSSFGFGGANAHVVLEEFVSQQAVIHSHDFSAHLIVLSAKDDERLLTYASAMKEFLAKKAFTGKGRLDYSLADFAYTLQVGREAMYERLAFRAKSFEEVYEKLTQFTEEQAYAKDIYRGSVRSDRAISALLLDGEAGDAFFRIVLKNNDLEKLGQLWVAGVEIDWQQFQAGKKPRRVSLPTYPFAKEQYWISEQQPLNLGRVSQTHVNRLHPLLGSNSSTLQEQKFTSRFTGEEFFLIDHIVNKQKILPGSAHLEMARAAGELAGSGKIAMIRDVVWIEPIMVDDLSREIQISLYPHDYKVTFEIKGLTANDRRVVYSHGTLLYQNTDTIKSPASPP